MAKPRDVSLIERLSQSTGAPQWLRQALNASAADEGSALWVEPSVPIRTSWLGDECARAVGFETLGHRVPINSATQRIFRIGRKTEDEIVADLKTAGLISMSKLVVRLVTPELEMRGEIDATIHPPDDLTHHLVLEVKSINHFLFSKLPDEHSPMLASLSPLNQRYPKYIKQTNTYMGLSGLHEGVVLFQEKGLGAQREFWLLFDEELFKATLAHAKNVYRYTSKQMLPPVPDDRAPHLKQDKVCSSCKRRYLCSLLPLDATTLEQVKTVDSSLRG